jgi:F-type H+-transporting ATPase subunit epsilon
VIFVRLAEAGPGPPGGESRLSFVANAFRVEIVSVESSVWAGEAEMVVARTTEGELAVLAGHAPLLGQLKEPSRVRIRTAEGGEQAWDIAGGFLSVTEDGVTVLAESAEAAHGDDPAQALIQSH